MQKQLDIIEHFKQNDCHGNGLVIKGKIRVGKSYLISTLIKLLLQNGFAIISNVRFDDSEFIKYKNRLFYIKSDTQYFNYYLEIPENTPIILVWDDIQAQEGFKSTDYDQFTKLSQFLIFMGKFDTNFIFCAHQKYVPDCILDMDLLYIYKKKREWFYVCTEFHKSLNDICSQCAYVPQPSNKKFKPLKLYSKAFSRFEWETDLNGLYNYLSGYNIKENIRKGVSEFLNKSESTDKYSHLKALSLKEIGLAIYFKRGMIGDSTPLNEFLNPNTLSSIKKLIKKEKLM